ncbi:50S ribosomal protein L35 [Candidatus Gracilibacteria bacterium]|nr:50S ribosomal protein L35 [Candidatus Gracilibacteria bacterium]
MKIKSNKSAAKRFRKTGSGKIVCRKAGRGHLLMQKSKRQKKLANKPKILARGDAKRVARLLPNL